MHIKHIFGGFTSLSVVSGDKGVLSMCGNRYTVSLSDPGVRFLGSPKNLHGRRLSRGRKILVLYEDAEGGSIRIVAVKLRAHGVLVFFAVTSNYAIAMFEQPSRDFYREYLLSLGFRYVVH